jgi:serine/threonine-protein kinase RsbW
MSESAIPPVSASVELHNQRAEIDRAVQDVLTAATRYGYPEASKFAIRLAIEEAVSNAFHHGHARLDRGVPITFSYTVAPDRVEMAVRDRGPGFNPDTVPDPTLEGNIEIPSGRGLLLMRAYMASVMYVPPGNEVRMVYRRPSARLGV